MLDRIFGYRSSSESSVPPVDCVECRVIGGGGLTALGGYIVYYAFQKKNSPNSNKLAVFGASFLGSVVMTLGVLRLIGMHDLIQQTKAHQAMLQNSKQVDKELLKD